MRSFLLIIIFWLLTPIFAAASIEMTIIYSGNLNGELEPCGCTLEGDLGGIKRRVTLIDALRKTSPDLFLISSGGLIVSHAASDQLTSKYILKGFEALNYDAIGVQWQDLSYGAEFIQTSHLPWVASNWQGDQFSNYKLIERGNKKLAFFSWIEPTTESQMITGANTFLKRTKARTKILHNNLAKAKSQNALTILAANLDNETALASLPLKHADILIIKSTSEKYAEPIIVKGTLVLEPGSRGMRLGRLDITLNSDSYIKSFRQQQFPLSPSIVDSPRMAAWYAEYNDRVKQDYVKSTEIRKAIELGERNYVGAGACKGCHQNAYNAWSKSQHAKAFDSLVEVNKDFDPDCIICHTVGFNQEGGYIDYKDTAHLAGVQCESCHGASRAHVTSNGTIATKQRKWPKGKKCIQCHTRKNSPNFRLDSYWFRISH